MSDSTFTAGSAKKVWSNPSIEEFKIEEITNAGAQAGSDGAGDSQAAS